MYYSCPVRPQKLELSPRQTDMSKFLSPLLFFSQLKHCLRITSPLQRACAHLSIFMRPDRRFFRGHLICAFALLCRHTLPTSQVLHGARRCVILFKEGNTSLKTSLGLGCIPVLTRRHIESAPPGPGPRARTEIMHYCTKICLTEPTQTIEKKSSIITTQILFSHICLCMSAHSVAFVASHPSGFKCLNQAAQPRWRWLKAKDGEKEREIENADVRQWMEGR